MTVLAPERLRLKKLDLEFREMGHFHILNGEKVPGATTISGMVDKDWLAPWASSECAKYVKAKWIPGVTYSLEEIEQITSDAKGAFARKRDKAADSGTVAHKWIEEFIKTGVNPQPTDPNYKNAEAHNSFKLFLRWHDQVNPIWLASEVQVASETHKCAAIVDSVFVDPRDGGVYDGEFKTSTDIFSYNRSRSERKLKKDFPIQTAGQVLMIEEMALDPINFKGRRILWFPKTGDNFVDHFIESPYEKDKQTFICALNFWKCLKLA